MPAPKPIEMILTRQLASALAMPVFIVDAAGTLVFCNESAEHVLGMRLEETDEMAASEWSTRWVARADDGTPIPPDRLPLMMALAERKPVHAKFWIDGLDGVRRHIETTAFPLSRHEQVLGAVAMFWEASP
jgi:PAS domain-containing protein